MSRAEALEFVQRIGQAVNHHDLSALAELYADDAVLTSPVFGRIEGRAAIVASWDTMFATLPDCGVEISDVLSDEDRVALIGTVTATDRIGWFGLAPTGVAIRYRAFLLCRLERGRIVREDRVYDSAGLLERLEKARLDKELHTAAEVQRALMPRAAHAAPHCESAGESVPCRSIGGDFFEFLDLPGGASGVVMGDVSGKGPPAALLAALVQGMFVAEGRSGDGPAAVVSRINERLAARDLDGRFATLAYAAIFPDGRLVCCNAGHNPPALLTREGIRRLATGGPIVGSFPRARFEEETVRLGPGDTLVMFTDGVAEARNAAQEEFGDDRLLACLSAAVASLPDTIARVLAAVREFSGPGDPADDMTVTVTRYTRA